LIEVYRYQDRMASASVMKGATQEHVFLTSFADSISPHPAVLCSSSDVDGVCDRLGNASRESAPDMLLCSLYN
jgi:hypothetical protein